MFGGLIAVAVMVAMRNTAAAVGAQVAITIIVGAGVVDEFRAESGYTRAFVMGATGAGAALLMSVFLPGRPARARIAQAYGGRAQAR